MRALLDVAQHQDQGPVLRREIAARQELSAHYIEQLAVKLKSAGLLESVRGQGGGYLLAKGAHQITAGDVIRAVEGPIALVECVAPGSRTPCRRVPRCVTHLLWKELSTQIEGFLDAVTLKDLCAQASVLEASLKPGESQRP